MDWEYPAPEKHTLALRVIFAMRYILLSVPLEFLSRCLSMFFLMFGSRLIEKSIPKSRAVSAVLYVIPNVLSSCTRCLAAYGSFAMMTPFVLSLRPSFWLIFANSLMVFCQICVYGFFASCRKHCCVIYIYLWEGLVGCQRLVASCP